MRKIMVCLALAIAAASVSTAARVFPDTPTTTTLWVQFHAVFVRGEQVIAVGNKGVATFSWNEWQTSLVRQSQTMHRMSPIRSKTFDDRLIVSDTGNHIVVFGVDQGQTATYLYTTNLPRDLGDSVDFAVYGDDILVSRNFDGMARFKMIPNGDAVLVDSTYRGILMKDLVVEGDTLYALDEYNGLMRYDLSGDTFGMFIDYLYSEYEAVSFSKRADKFYFVALPGGLLQGSFGHTGSGIEKSFGSISSNARVQAIETKFVVQTERSIACFDWQNPSLKATWPVDNGLRYGDLYYQVAGDIWFLYPDAKGGITRYSISYRRDPEELLDRPGPVTGLDFLRGRLVAAGARNPYDIFTLDSAGHIASQFPITSTHTSTGPMVVWEDTLIGLYPEAQRLGAVHVDFATQQGYVIAATPADSAQANDIQQFAMNNPSRRVVVAAYQKHLHAYPIDDSTGFGPVIEWRAPVGEAIQAFTVYGSVVAMATNKSEIVQAVMDSSLQIERYLPVRMQGGSVTALLTDSVILYVFREQRADMYDVTDPSRPAFVGSVTLPKSVLDARRFGKYIFTVGTDGLQVLDIKDTIPEIVDTGGFGGNIIAVDSNHIAVSDGSAVEIYPLWIFGDSIPPDDTVPPPPPPPHTLPKTFAISQNYPNPFNGTTYIEYDIPVLSMVTIELYNALGQRVTTLVSSVKDPGRYRAVWNGTNQNGADVASGIYFYRFTAGNSQIVKKMVYLK